MNYSSRSILEFPRLKPTSFLVKTIPPRWDRRSDDARYDEHNTFASHRLRSYRLDFTVISIDRSHSFHVLLASESTKRSRIFQRWNSFEFRSDLGPAARGPACCLEREAGPKKEKRDFVRMVDWSRNDAETARNETRDEGTGFLCSFERSTTRRIRESVCIVLERGGRRNSYKSLTIVRVTRPTRMSVTSSARRR